MRICRTFKPPSPSSVLPTPKKPTSPWCVYLILSTNAPFKTYVGSTTDFPRRLKQHNGEIEGGAKACHAGRPWICACIVTGFDDQSEACKFEYKWKSYSRRSARKVKNDESRASILQHRRKALDRLTEMLTFSDVEVDWKIDP